MPHPRGACLKTHPSQRLKQIYECKKGFISKWEAIIVEVAGVCLDIVEETGYEGNARYTKPIYVVLLCEVYREKSLRHVPMVAKFLDDKKSKIHLKSEFALFQT